MNYCPKPVMIVVHWLKTLVSDI